MLVGRTQELGVINAAFERMLAGEGNVLFLTGEAGLGKTTLIHEWWHTIAAETAIYAESACSIPIGNVDVGALEALQPWADVVAQLENHTGKNNTKFDVKRLIRDAAPSWAWAIPFVGDIAHAAVETHRLVKEQRGESEHNPNASNQQQVFQQYVNLLTKIAEDTPLVILLDDMHWADASSVNLLFYLSRQISSKKIFLIVTYRPDDALTAGDGKGHPILQVKNEILRYGGKEYPLTYLGDTAIRDYLISLFPAYKINDTFERWLRKISDGNSLFVTQFIKTLWEDAQLSDAGAFTGAYENIKTPDSALAVVMERTRRLDSDTRELLMYATAEGEEFTAYVLEQLSEIKTMQLLKELQQASSAGMIVQKGKSRMFANKTTTIYGFSHALFHKALYDTLLDDQKEFLHRKCFELLKAEWDRLSDSNERTLTIASKLLTHAEKCNEDAIAAKMALEAAQIAWQNFAEAEALEMIGHVRRLAESKNFSSLKNEREELLGDTAMLLSRIDVIRGRYDEALKNAGEALDYFEKGKNEFKSADALNQHGNINFYKSAYNKAETEARMALTMAKRTCNMSGEANALNTIGLVMKERGAYDAARECFEESFSIRESIGNQIGAAAALNNIGTVYCSSGANDKALEYHTKSLTLRESIGDRHGLSSSLCNIGTVHFSLGSFSLALEYFIKSLEIMDSIGDRSGIAYIHGNIGAVYSVGGSYTEAVNHFTISLEIMESIGDLNGIASTQNNIGNVLSDSGMFDGALGCFQKSTEIYESIHNSEGIVASLLGMGILHRKQGDLEQSRIILIRTETIASEIQAKEYIAGAKCELGMLCEAEAMQRDGDLRIAKLREAATLLEDGLAIFREMKSGRTQGYEGYLTRIKAILS